MSYKATANRIVLKSDAIIYNPLEAGEITKSEDFHFLKNDGDVITITTVMKGILEALALDLKLRGAIDVREAFIDASFVPAKKGA